MLITLKTTHFILFENKIKFLCYLFIQLSLQPTLQASDVPQGYILGPMEFKYKGIVQEKFRHHFLIHINNVAKT